MLEEGVKLTKFHCNVFEPCSSVNSDFCPASRHMGNTTVPIVNSNEIVNNPDI